MRSPETEETRSPYFGAPGASCVPLRFDRRRVEGRGTQAQWRRDAGVPSAVVIASTRSMTISGGGRDSSSSRAVLCLESGAGGTLCDT